jgi:hypothetical protein
MNTLEIERILRRKCPIFLGVYALDKLPHRVPPHRPIIMVANTDPSNRPGTHWIAIYMGETCEFFDSFGRPPPAVFLRYIKKHCIKKWTYNSRRLQSIYSRYCGHYCVLYCMLKYKGHCMFSIMRRFTNDVNLNDYIASEFVRRISRN